MRCFNTFLYENHFISDFRFCNIVVNQFHELNLANLNSIMCYFTMQSALFGQLSVNSCTGTVSGFLDTAVILSNPLVPRIQRCVIAARGSNGLKVVVVIEFRNNHFKYNKAWQICRLTHYSMLRQVDIHASSKHLRVTCFKNKIVHMLKNYTKWKANISNCKTLRTFSINIFLPKIWSL